MVDPNAPKRRQLRQEGRRLARKRAALAGLPAILIVCEGRETEPNYIRGFCDARGINRANVTIALGDHETDAPALVMRARRRFQVDRDFDRVFVVCDCAGESLAEAQRLAAVRLKNASGNMLSIELIVSRPCFEYWMLLHFEYNARPFRNADEVIGILRRHVTDYDKADRRIFEKVASGLDRARANVTSLQAELAATQSQSPNTDMSVLVAALDGLRREEH